MTEDARKHTDTLKNKASRAAGQAKDTAYDTADSVQQGAKDAAGNAQQQGESAWQKVKEVVNDAYEHVRLHPCFFLAVTCGHNHASCALLSEDMGA